MKINVILGAGVQGCLSVHYISYYRFSWWFTYYSLFMIDRKVETIYISIADFKTAVHLCAWLISAVQACLSHANDAPCCWPTWTVGG